MSVSPFLGSSYDFLSLKTKSLSSETGVSVIPILRRFIVDNLGSIASLAAVSSLTLSYSAADSVFYM